MITLSYGKLVKMKLYRFIPIRESQIMSQIHRLSKPFGSAIEKDYVEDIHKSLLVASTNSSTTSGSTLMIFDRQLKDFKKKIMENKEPKQVSYIRKIVTAIIIFVFLLSSLSFYYNQIGFQNVQSLVYQSHYKTLRQRSLIQL